MQHIVSLLPELFLQNIKEMHSLGMLPGWEFLDKAKPISEDILYDLTLLQPILAGFQKTI